MKITQDVRDYAREQGVADDAEALAKGMADKAREFRERGGEVYLAAGEQDATMQSRAGS